MDVPVEWFVPARRKSPFSRSERKRLKDLQLLDGAESWFLREEAELLVLYLEACDHRNIRIDQATDQFLSYEPHPAVRFGSGISSFIRLEDQLNYPLNFPIWGRPYFWKCGWDRDPQLDWKLNDRSMPEVCSFSGEAFQARAPFLWHLKGEEDRFVSYANVRQMGLTKPTQEDIEAALRTTESKQPVPPSQAPQPARP